MSIRAYNAPTMNIPTTAKCPYCDGALPRVTGGHTTVTIPGGKDYNGIVYACPKCQKALSVQIDPLAVRTEIVAQVVDQLFERLRK